SSADAIKVHPYAQVAWNILTLAYKVVQKQQDTDDRLLELVQTMVEVYSFVEDVEFLSQKIKRLEDSVLGITRETVECAIFIHEYTGKGFAGRVVRDTWSDTSETIDRLSAVLLQLKDAFDRGIAIQTTFISVKLLDAVESIPQILKDLNPAEFDAATREVCLPGTRTEILSEIRNWLSVPSDTGNIIWLHGVFGAGKSAISLSVSEYFRSLNRLGAFVFFTRTNLAGSTPNLVIRTIAYWLAKTNENIRAAICDAITAEPTLVTAPIHTQFQKLLMEPLLAAKNDIRGPVIIILDALDECGTRHSRRGLVSLIANEFPKLPAVFRIFITSRPDSDIAEQFRAQPLITAMQLDITTTATKNDILAYITQTMQNIRRIKASLGPEWPGESTIQLLANYSGGLFIWASTASKFLSESFNPQKALTILLNSGRNLAGKIDELYTLALQTSINWDDETFAQDALQVLGAVVLARRPLSDHMIDAFLGFEPGRSSAVLQYLGCVVQWSPGQSAQLLHASFSDYITDPKRSGNHPWFINPGTQSRWLALGCLQVLNRELRFNICDLQDSHILNVHVEDLEARVKTGISPKLAYASDFWAIHLQHTSHNQETLDELEVLMKKNFLYWLEILSVRMCVSAASQALEAALNYVQEEHGSLQAFIIDALKFMAAFAPVISQSAPHIYLSAIPFAPVQSQIRNQFSMFYPQTLHFDGPSGRNWPNIQKVLEGHSRGMMCVAFSPDGTRIVSGSVDGTVRLWDSESGAVVVGPLEGHTLKVIYVKFSPDGERILSQSLEAVIVWDSDTGTMVAGPLMLDSDYCSVAFSQDGKRIISMSKDMTLQVWDYESGTPITGLARGAGIGRNTNYGNRVAISPDGTRIASASQRDRTVQVCDSESGTITRGLEARTDVICVAFSPDGKRIVSTFSQKTIVLWDANTGAILAGPLQGHTGPIYSVAFSSDGNKIVSGSSDNTVRVWDSESGAPLTELKGHSGDVVSVAFSHDGRRIVSASEDDTVRVWYAGNNEMLAPVVEKRRSPHSKLLAFSPDGRWILVASPDNAIEVWDIETNAMFYGRFEGHTDTIKCVVFSPDATRIVSGSNDTTVRVWNFETRDAVAGPFKHPESVTALGFSPDGRRVVSASHDFTVRVWDAETGMIVLGPLTERQVDITHVAFSPDGKQFTSVTQKPYIGQVQARVQLWNSETGVAIASTFLPCTRSIAISPDCQWSIGISAQHYLPMKGYATVQVWSNETGLVVGSLDFPAQQVINGKLAFSPDGKQIASGSSLRAGNAKIEVWNWETASLCAGPLQPIASIIGYSTPEILFAADGTNIVSGLDGIIRGWKASRLPIQNSDHWGNHPRCEDGWLINSSSEHILWVPPWLREDLVLPWNSFVVSSRPTTKLDLTHFVHGTEWQKCMDPK
ncbi:WD40-repeat-containing domain protein, partial [Mycena epipterygia]